MEEIICTTVLEVVKCLAPLEECRLGYLRNYKDNFDNSKAEMKNLKVQRTSIQGRVSKAKEKGEEIEEKVENCLINANKIIEQAAEFIQGEESTNKRCLKGLCLKTRYQFSKKAETEVKALIKVGEEVKELDSISHPTISVEIWLKSNKGYEAFE